MNLGEWEDQFSIDGCPVKQSKDSMHESYDLNLSIYDLIFGIKYGDDCPKKWDRKQFSFEICFYFGGKLIRIVYVYSFSFDHDSECILIIHVGEVT